MTAEPGAAAETGGWRTAREKGPTAPPGGRYTTVPACIQARYWRNRFFFLLELKNRTAIQETIKQELVQTKQGREKHDHRAIGETRTDDN